MTDVTKRAPEQAGEPRDPAGSPATVRLTAYVSGYVQGVGFRWWTRSRALELGLVGQAENLPDGRVRVVADGSREGCQALLELLSARPAPPVPPDAPRSYYRRPGHVESVVSYWSEPDPGPAPRGFVEG
jgi:acylphosphatase